MVKKKRIGINCNRVNKDYVGGINTYIFGLLNGFSKFTGNLKFQVYVNKDNRDLFENRFDKIDNIEIIELTNYQHWKIIQVLMYLPFLNFFNKKIHELLSFKNVKIIEKNSDLLYVPTTTLDPYDLKIPTIVSMHDIQEFHFPEFFSWGQKIARKISHRNTVEMSDYIQTSSEFIRKDILNCYKHVINEKKLFVIPEGVDVDLFSSFDLDNNIKSKYKLPKKFILFPAQMWPHKNHLRLLESLKLIKNKNNTVIPLVLTGQKFKYSRKIFDYIHKNNLENQIFYLGKIPKNDLISLYKTAAFLINPVLYESSSLPILEACASGTPCVVSSIPSNKELGEVLKLTFFDPYSIEKMSSVILHSWTNTKKFNEEIQKNNKSIKDFDWAKICQSYSKYFLKFISS